MREFAKTIASKLPFSFQQEMKRVWFALQIKRGRFVTDELEFDRLSEWVSPGDWVLDVGANVGHYTFRLSDLVGNEGRVIAFEPVTATHELLSANVRRLKYDNVTLMNVGASEATKEFSVDIPKFDTGLNNYYMASLTEGSGEFKVMCISIDSLNLPERVSLVKIDAEGHDFQVLKGMTVMLEKDHPVLIVEDGSGEVDEFLTNLGYSASRSIAGSHNRVYAFESSVK